MMQEEEDKLLNKRNKFAAEKLSSQRDNFFRCGT